MKALIVILLMTVACRGSHYGYEQLCLKGNEGFLRHPQDCHKFIRCSHQRAYEFQCPSNLLWHHEIKTCDFSYRTQCKLNDQRAKDKESNNLQNIEATRNEETGIKLKGKYKDNLTKKSQTQPGFKKKSQKFKRNTNIQRKCRLATVRGNVNTKHTVNDVTESMLKVSAVKLTELNKVAKATTNNSLEKNKIVMENLFTESSNVSNKGKLNSKTYATETEQTITSNEIIETSFTEFTTKKYQNATTESFKYETTVEENNITNHAKKPSFIYSAYNSIKSPFTKIRPEETKSSDTVVLLMKQQNSIFQITTEINPIKLTESSTFSTTIIEKEAKNNSVTLGATTESFISPLSLTDNSVVKATDEENDNIILTTKFSGNSSQSSVKTGNMNMATNLNDSVNTTETPLTTYSAKKFTENFNSTLLEMIVNSHKLPVNLSTITEDSVSKLSSTEKSTVKTSDAEATYNDRSAAKFNKSSSNFTKSFAVIYNRNITDFKITADNNYVNIAESTLALYNTESTNLDYNSTRRETNVLNLQELKASTKTSNEFLGRFSSSSTFKTTDTLHENVSFNTKDPAYLFTHTHTEISTQTNSRNILRESEHQTTLENETVNLTEPTLINYPNFYSATQKNETNSDNSIELSSKITRGSTTSSSPTDYFTVKLEDKEIENIHLTTKNSFSALEKFKVTDNITEIELPITLDDNSANLTELVLTAYLETVKTNGSFSDNPNDTKNENTTKEPDILQDLTAVTEIPVKFTETPVIETRVPGNKATLKEAYKQSTGNLETITSFTEHSSVTMQITSTEAVPETTKQNVNNIKPAHLTDLPEIAKNLPHLTSFLDLKYPSESTTSAISTTLQNYFSYDSVTQDPRLPFRSIECQGANNRRQLKAQKCYQYYQCFAGWAFLLNCHEGWRFQVKQAQCVLDVNGECDAE